MDEIRPDNIAYIKAKEYYPKYWELYRIIALYRAGKLNRAEYIDIVGEEPPAADAVIEGLPTI